MPKNDTVYVPPLSPSGATQYGQALQSALQSYEALLAQWRMDRAKMTGSFKEAKTQISQAYIENLSAHEGTTIEAGRLGSSRDVEGRVGLKAQALQAMEEARKQKAEALQSGLSTVQQAETDLSAALAAAQAGAAAEQSDMATGAFATGTVPGGGGGGASIDEGLGSHGPGGTPAGEMATPALRDAMQEVRSRILNLLRERVNAVGPSARALNTRLHRLINRYNRLRGASGLDPVTLNQMYFSQPGSLTGAGNLFGATQTGPPQGIGSLFD